jgi:hypothetical protein
MEYIGKIRVKRGGKPLNSGVSPLRGAVRMPFSCLVQSGKQGILTHRLSVGKLLAAQIPLTAGAFFPQCFDSAEISGFFY